MPAGLMIPTGNMSPTISTFPDINDFESALALTQPNLLDTPLHQLDVTSESTDLLLLGDNELDSTNTKSGSDNPEGGGSGEDQDQGQDQEAHPNKKKKYHRHTPHQIQEMEAFFKKCPHPDDKQRKELSQELGLDPLQIKFWFQNKRTQMKTQGERHENTQLKNENERLRADNIRFREALKNASCPSCGGPTALSEMSLEEHRLRLENARLREEIDKISVVAANHISQSTPNYALLPSTGSFGGQEADIGGEMYMNGGLLRSMSAPTEADKNMILKLAVSAMEEFITMAQMGQPLWIPNLDATNVVLNEEEYLRRFPRGFGLRLTGFRCEASRESAVIVINHLNLVEYFMDVNQWSALFSGIVSKAVTLEVLSTGVAGNYNGAVQVMAAELNLPTPLVAVRESYFVRYCKQHGDGIWAVVDVSLDNIRPTAPTSNCRKRASGCLIQETPSGYSKVTWIENVEVDEGGAHNLYKKLVNSGTAFGAKRWVATLDRQCERLATALATNIPIGVITTQLGVKSTLKLAERMVLSFCNGVSASSAQNWVSLAGTGADDVRVVSRTVENDPGRPSGLTLSAATTLWLPVAPTRVFDYLRNQNSRPQWDILSTGGMVQQLANIEIGRTAGNCISLLKVNSGSSSQSNMLIVQESCTDSVVSLVVYAPVDMNAMNAVVHGGDSDYVEILPSGFAIFPDGNIGSLLTVSFQILVEALPASKLTVNSVATVNNLIACTVDRIRSAFLS